MTPEARVRTAEQVYNVKRVERKKEESEREKERERERGREGRRTAREEVVAEENLVGGKGENPLGCINDHET